MVPKLVNPPPDIREGDQWAAFMVVGFSWLQHMPEHTKHVKCI